MSGRHESTFLVTGRSAAHRSSSFVMFRRGPPKFVEWTERQCGQVQAIGSDVMLVGPSATDMFLPQCGQPKVSRTGASIADSVVALTVRILVHSRSGDLLRRQI